MSYQALYRAWRPNTFSEIVDQDAVVRTLRRQVVTGRIAHAYLFCGSRGTGKTTAAKVLSRAINCLSPRDGDPCGECEICRAILSGTCMDVQEIDAASNNGVDEIRDLRDKIRYPPTLTRYKVYIIDEVHMLSSGAFNALLKTLEEPPEHAVFILATTEPNKLPATILSRCQRFDFHRIRVDAIVGRLKVVLKGIGREAEDAALAEIARAAEGALRDALSLMDVCLSFTDGTVTAQLARDVLGSTGRDFMFEFADALISWDAGRALNKLDEAMRRGSDPRVFAMDAANHLRALLLADAAGEGLAKLMDITPEDAQRFLEQAGNANREQLMRAMELFMRVESDMKWATQPRTILELNTVRACHPEQEESPELAERLARVEKLLKRGTITVAAPQAGEPSPQGGQIVPGSPANPPSQGGQGGSAPTLPPRDGTIPPSQSQPQISPSQGGQGGSAPGAAGDGNIPPSQSQPQISPSLNQSVSPPSQDHYPNPPSQGGKGGSAPALPPREYLDAVEEFLQEYPSMRKFLEDMSFVGVQADMVTVRLLGKNGMTVRHLIEHNQADKKAALEAMLSKHFGGSMQLTILTGNEAPPAPRNAVRDVIQQSLDVFGRDKIDFTD